VAASPIRNQLITAIKSHETIATYHKKIKTYLFKIAFSTITIRWFQAPKMTFACPHL